MRRQCLYNRYAFDHVLVVKRNIFTVRADDELLGLIAKASRLSRLNKSEVTRQSVRLGAAQLVRRYTTNRPSFVQYLAGFKGLELPRRRHPVRRRS